MGMLVDGKWMDEDQIIESGAFVREPSTFAASFDLDAGNSAPPDPRYWLIASRSCPWSHGATMARALLGLERHVGVHIARGPRIEGYATNGGEEWAVPGTPHRFKHLHQLYTLADPTFTGRSTIPVLWDRQTSKILSNDSRLILRAFSNLNHQIGRRDTVDLAPVELRDDIDMLNDWLFANLNNAVYRAGFAESQGAYDDAVKTVFMALDALESRLEKQCYLLGDEIAEADLRLFSTLVRFDSVYVTLHRCCRKRLTEFPALWSYARSLYALPEIKETVDFSEILRGSYLNDTSNNPHNITPVLPDADWGAPHDRQMMSSVSASVGTLLNASRVPKTT